MSSMTSSMCRLEALGDGQHDFQMDVPLNAGYIIGRSDEGAHFVPDIDLVGCASREKGVSRRHAALISYRGAPHIIDLFSVNGTYLNGERLVPDQPYPLRPVNQLRLGTLDLIITIY